MGRALARVEVTYEVRDPAFVVVGHRSRPDHVVGILADFPRAFVGHHDGQTPVEERHLLEAPGECLVVVVGGLEDLGVGPEGHGRPGVIRRRTTCQRSNRYATAIRLGPFVPVSPHLNVEIRGQRIDDGDADAVQPTRDGIAGAAELPACMEHGHHDFDGRSLLLRVFVHRNASTVVDDAHPAVRQQRDLDSIAVPSKGLVHGVVHDFVDEVVQSAFTGGTDVHPRSLAYGLETLKDRDRTGVV